jgi:diguanylate cyclase
MALNASAIMVHAPSLVGASLAVAISASGLALWLAGGVRGRPPLLLSAIAFGMAVSGMHYTAMAGLTLFPHPNFSPSAPALSKDLLAIVVAIVAFLVSAVFLLFLIPDRSRLAADQVERKAIGSAAEHVEIGPSPGSQTTPAEVSSAGGGAELGRGTYAPLGGAGGPRRRFARHLPVEREGATHFVAVDEVVAVHANAHYTYIFDGTAKLFCPLAIGDVEARLDANRFVRVHRSHIVNIERVVGLKRAGDSGVVELAATDHYEVPVSRSRVSWLKSRIESKIGEVAPQTGRA